MTRALLSAREIRAQLWRAWQDRNAEMAASGNPEAAERLSREAGELVMQLARGVEAACGY